MRILHSIWLIVAMMVILAACAPPAAPGNLKVPEPSLAVSPQPPAGTIDGVGAAPTAVLSIPLKPTEEMNLTTTPKIEPGMESLIEVAIADLMKRLSITRDAIEVVSAQSVVWPDTSMGCPQPGMAYLQVPEDGALIVLRVEKSMYEYHNGGSRGVFLCEQVYKDPYPPPKIDLSSLTPFRPDNGIPPGGDK